MAVSGVAEEAQVLPERPPDVLQSGIRNCRCHDDCADQESERTRDVSAETHEDQSASRNLDKTPQETPQGTGERMDQE